MAEERDTETNASETNGSETNGSGDEESTRVEDASKITAPSIGPNTVIEREDPEERLARHEQSDVDAMGNDKRRPVVGQSYGPSMARQASMYGIFFAVLAAVVIGFILLANKLDQPPETVQAKAPWVGTEKPPKPLE
jgi:hypothetical protein